MDFVINENVEQYYQFMAVESKQNQTGRPDTRLFLENFRNSVDIT